MTVLQYEDTVEPEQAPCEDCGEMVDEGAVIRIDGDWLCESCGEAQRAFGGGDGSEVRCVNAHDRCYEGGPCPYCEPRA